jgi:nitrous oxide reductase
MSDHTTRRRFLGSAGAVTVTALAGCTDSGSGGDEDGGMTESATADGMDGSSMEGRGNETMDGGTNESSMDG